MCKLPCLNSLISHFPETLDLAFKLKRKKFLIEVLILARRTYLHLPRKKCDTLIKLEPNLLN